MINSAVLRDLDLESHLKSLSYKSWVGLNIMTHFAMFNSPEDGLLIPAIKDKHHDFKIPHTII